MQAAAGEAPTTQVAGAPTNWATAVADTLQALAETILTALITTTATAAVIITIQQGATVAQATHLLNLHHHVAHLHHTVHHHAVVAVAASAEDLAEAEAEALVAVLAAEAAEAVAEGAKLILLKTYSPVFFLKKKKHGAFFIPHIHYLSCYEKITFFGSYCTGSNQCACTARH